MPDIDERLTLTLAGFQEAQRETARLQVAVSSLRQEATAFNRSGGLGSLAGGLDNLTAAEARVVSLQQRMAGVRGEVERSIASASSAVSGPTATPLPTGPGLGEPGFDRRLPQDVLSLAGLDTELGRFGQLAGEATAALSGANAEWGLVAGNLLATAGTAAVLIAALKIGQGIVEDAQKPLQAWLNTLPEITAAQADYFDLIESGTTASVEAIREEARLKEQLINIQIEQVERLISEANTALEADGAGLGIPILGDIRRELLGLAGLGTGAAEEKLADYNAQLDQNAAVLALLDDKYVQSHVAVHDYINELEQAAETQVELNKLISFGTSEQVKRLAQEAEIDQSAVASSISGIEEEIINELEKVRPAFAEIARLELGNDDLRQRQIDFLKQLEQSDAGGTLEELAQELEDLDVQAAALEQQIEQYNNVALPQIAAREAELEAIERTKDALDDLAQQREETLGEIQRIDGQIENLLVSRQQEIERQAERDGLAAQQQGELSDANAALRQAQEEQNLRQLQRRVDDVARNGHQRQVEIVQKAQADIASILKAGNEQLTKTQADADKQRLREVRDYNIRRQRLEDDLAASLLEAALENNVVTFIASQRRGLQQIGRTDEDFGIQQGDKAEDLQERLETIRQRTRAEVAEQREGTIRIVNETREQVEARVQTLREGDKQERTDVDRAQEALTRLRERHLQERENLESRFAEEDFWNRVSALDQQKVALQGKYEELNQLAIQNSAALASNMVTSWLNNAVAAFQAFSPGRGAIQFINPTFGDVATQSGVQRAVNDIRSQMVTVDNLGRFGRVLTQ